MNKTFEEMESGIYYKVVVPSDDGTFLVGDTIILCEADGSILSMTVGGWIPKENVIEATGGMQVTLDRKHYQDQLADLESQQAQVTALLNQFAV